MNFGDVCVGGGRGNHSHVDSKSLSFMKPWGQEGGNTPARMKLLAG